MPEQEPQSQIEPEKKEEEIEKQEEVKGIERGEEREEEPRVEKEGKPWEKMRREEEFALIDSFVERAELSEEVRETLDRFFEQEIRRTERAFAREWCEEHKEEIEAKGLDIGRQEIESSYLSAVKLGGFEELKTQEKYQDINEAIENLYALRTDLKKKYIPMESQYLMLNFLGKKAEALEKERRQAEAKGDVATVMANEQQLEELFKFREELGSKASFRNLRGEAEGKVEPLEEKESYLESNLPEKVAQVQDPLAELDYKKEGRGWWRWKRIKIIDKQGNVLGEFKKQEADKFLKQKLEEKLKEDLGSEWEEKNKKREAGIRKLIAKELRLLERAPEKALEGVEGMYRQVKRRLITEHIEKGLKKEKKTRQQLEKVKEVLSEQGRNPEEFIDEALHRKGALEKIKGNWEGDQENLSQFLSSWGLEIPSERVEELRGSMGKRGLSYEKAARKQRGLLIWLLELIFLFFEEVSKTETKKK